MAYKFDTYQREEGNREGTFRQKKNSSLKGSGIEGIVIIPTADSLRGGLLLRVRNT